MYSSGAAGSQAVQSEKQILNQPAASAGELEVTKWCALCVLHHRTPCCIKNAASRACARTGGAFRLPGRLWTFYRCCSSYRTVRRPERPYASWHTLFKSLRTVVRAGFVRVNQRRRSRGSAWLANQARASLRSPSSASPPDPSHRRWCHLNLLGRLWPRPLLTTSGSFLPGNSRWGQRRTVHLVLACLVHLVAAAVSHVGRVRRVGRRRRRQI